MESARIILLCVLAAVLYGIAQDQVTARVCVEYFSIGHPPVFRTESPTLLALGWGVLATWWVGLILGAALAAAARAGKRPRLSWRDLLRPVAALLAATGVLAFVAGNVGHALAVSRLVWLFEPLASRVPRSRHIAFLTDLWAHNAAYLAGFVGGALLCVSAWRKRGRLAKQLPNARGGCAGRPAVGCLLVCLSLVCLLCWRASATFEDPYPFADPIVVWQRSLPHAGRCSVLVCAKSAVVSDCEGDVLKIDLASGEVRWERPLGKDFAAGILRTDGARLLTYSWEGRICVMDLWTGEVLWKDQVEVLREHPYMQAEIAGDRIVVKTYTAIAAFDLQTGKPIWTQAAGWGYAHVQGDILIVDQEDSTGDEELVGHSVRTGETLWTYRPGRHYAELLTMSGSLLGVRPGRGGLVVLDSRDGHAIWGPVLACCGTLIAVHSDIVTLTEPQPDGDRACGLSLTDGHRVWSGPPGTFAPDVPLQRCPGSYYVWKGKSPQPFLRLDAQSGAVIWSAPDPLPRTAFLSPRTRAIEETGDDVRVIIGEEESLCHWLYCLDRDSGAPRWRMELDGEPLLVPDGGILLSNWEGNLRLLRP